MTSYAGLDLLLLILPINATTTNEKERQESAKELQQLIMHLMSRYVKLCWFGFLLAILTIAEDEHKAVLTLEKCYELGGTLGMNQSETKEAIQFFHDISLIMYFDTPKLRDSVIIDTKV